MRETPPGFYVVGDKVPQRGTYRVFHGPRRLIDEVTLVRHETFPRCSVCDDDVQFGLVKTVGWGGHDMSFRIRLYEVPHPRDEDIAAGEMAT